MTRLLLLLLLTACRGPGTFVEIERDAATGAITGLEFDRSWQGGPVDAEVTVSPDGTITFRWVSDVNLDAAVLHDYQITQRFEQSLRAIEAAAALATKGATP
mgnify:CR=1 FL=1